jgi:Protein of unknown function (DUF1275)
MWKLTSVDEILPFALLGLTGVTGLVDAVSFLALGHVFTANMTGNSVFLGIGNEVLLVCAGKRTGMTPELLAELIGVHSSCVPDQEGKCPLLAMERI